MGGDTIDIEKPDAEDEKFKDYVKVRDINPFLDELKGLKPALKKAIIRSKVE